MTAHPSPTRETAPSDAPQKDEKNYLWRDALETRLMRLVGATMERASWDACRYSGARLGLLFFAALKRRREVATGNVLLAFPHMSQAAARQMARRSAQNFAMTFCEFLHLRAASRSEVRAYADIEGLEHIQAGFQDGRGVLLLTAHLGNWELMGARAAQEFRLVVVARPSSNSGLQRHISDVRDAAGIEVISKFDTGRASLGILRANAALGVLPDQHAGKHGALLPLFGHPTRFVTGLARLALLSGAPLVPSFGVRRAPWLADGRNVAKVSPGFHLKLRKGADAAAREQIILDGTRQVMAQIENIVRQYPEQWLWMHRRWRPEDKAAVGANGES